MQLLQNRYLPFYLFGFGVILALLLPPLLQYGMFMDGVQYACVSMNLAEGKGSFWFPYLNESWDIHNSYFFAEHPPLFYFFESIFFKVFGNVFYTEGLFCLCCALVNAVLIHLIWSQIAEQFKLEKRMSWFPVLLWISIPVCFWAFRNNMIEILMSVFDLLAIYFLLPFLFGKKYKLIFVGLSGLAVLGAALTKGLPGLFPLATIPLYYLSTKNISFWKAFAFSLLHIAVPVAIFLLLYFFNSKAHESLNFHLTKRLLYRINNQPSADSRFYIVGGLLFELIPVFVTSLLLLLVKKRNRYNVNNIAIFFLLLGLSGVLPLMATLVQNRFYFVAALPYLAIGFALLSYSRIETLCEKIIASRILKPVLTTLSVLLITGSVFYAAIFFGSNSRDSELINDAKIIGENTKGQTKLYAVYDAFAEWNFQFYLYRYNHQSVETTEPLPYFISNERLEKPGYELMPLPTKRFHLYKKIN